MPEIPPTPDAIHSAIERVARESRGRLLAFLAARSGGDLAGAEDALSDAFVAAIRQWPGEGIPQQPEAWLMACARRRLIDAQRRGEVRKRMEDQLTHAMDSADLEIAAHHDFPDERLKLLFVCAHPAIDPAVRTPLMLQTVLGLEAEQIASAFLISPTAMSQRLVRAKAKIRDSRIPFVIPPRGEWESRLADVLDAVYVAFTCGWADDSCDLEEEAVWLGRVLARLLPEEPEVLGLLALMLHSRARRHARMVGGVFVPLPEQDTAHWDGEMITEAISHLNRAARLRSPGRFQMEAVIQSIHADRARTGTTDWAAIVQVYRLLVTLTPGIGARIGHAVAVAQSEGAATGLALLDELPQDSIQHHQPYWAVRARLLADSRQDADARAAYTRAIGLCEDARIRAYLIRERLTRTVEF